MARKHIVFVSDHFAECWKDENEEVFIHERGGEKIMNKDKVSTLSAGDKFCPNGHGEGACEIETITDYVPS